MKEEKKDLPVPAEEDIEYVEAEPVRSTKEVLEEVDRRLAEIDMVFALCLHHVFAEKRRKDE